MPALASLASASRTFPSARVGMRVPARIPANEKAEGEGSLWRGRSLLCMGGDVPSLHAFPRLIPPHPTPILLLHPP